jgi:hypothetical protein
VKHYTRLARPVVREIFRQWPGRKTPVTSEELKKIFGQCVENAQFDAWNKGEVPGVRFVYACELGTIWKFTPKEWWLFVTRAIRNRGCHDLVLSKALRTRPKYIVRGENSEFYSSDIRMRCVNPLDWSFQDWANELSPDRRSTQSVASAPPLGEFFHGHA